MSDRPDTRKQSAGGAVKPDPRQDRLKSALRENLKRRKSQARGRQSIQETQQAAENADPADAADLIERSVD